jgi:hypothetical protein
MDVTYEMLQAAMRKAAEAGLLPRHARSEDARINQELVRAVVQAALDASPGRSASQAAQPARRRALSGIAGVPSVVPGYYRYFAK